MAKKKKKTFRKRNENGNVRHLRPQTGWCLHRPRDPSSNDVAVGVESPHFSSIHSASSPLSLPPPPSRSLCPPLALSLSVLHLSVVTITSLICNHIDKLKLSSSSCFSIVSCGRRQLWFRCFALKQAIETGQRRICKSKAQGSSLQQ